ncbi:hypothetical protein GON26_15500 [Flavobacterium sp. GA093]|uniref:MG2 domain-containing protein n=1 Tax=Flavobacterium hydrocarbonoxydans TaxID=2683249 RepID=A0A6I4NNQ2_9FLAO|nr:hypothetical protein [Flavobacterium hydrocarbonoxydans]MWB95773.1 hypothetical protein [Flavobacterium hydrocarbonoxydans]
MDRLKHFIIVFVFINIQIISAQQTVALDETVFIHTNTTTIVSGETLLYKIYCLKSSDKTPSHISKVAYVELVDSDRKSVFKNKIFLENSKGQGDYFIPTTLKTGNYKLVGFTNWMLNNTESGFFEIDITIINPYKANELASAGSSNTNINFQSVNNSTNSTLNNISSGNLSLKLNKKAFTNREFVDLKIEALDKIFEDGNYSLSVRKVDGLTVKNQISATDFTSKSYNTILDLQSQKTQLPELRGEIISGKVTAKNNTDKVDNLLIAFSLPGKSFAFKVVKTDAGGNFIFNIDKAYYNSEITVQIIENQSNNYTLTLNNLSEIDYSKLSFNPNYNLPFSIKENILDRSVSSQIENAYYHKKADNITKPATLESFYYPVAKEYILDDFTRFKTLRETITEVATEAYSKQNNGKYYLHVTDPNVFPQLPEPALVLVDGLYLENQNELFNYSMKNIYKIEIIVGRYTLGPKSFNGLVSFTTFDKDFKSTQNGSSIIKTTILRPQPKKIYNRIDYTNPIDYESIPDFRNQLFWNPDVKLNNDSNNTFYTSDVSGTFEIKLEGFAKNGTPISLKETFEVKDSSAN